MRKELRPGHDPIPCDVCGRTILKGERIETFVAAGDRRKVCELCTFQALRMGWPRESALEDHSPERERLRPQRPLWSRIVGWAEEQGLLGPLPPGGEAGSNQRAAPPASPSGAEAPAEGANGAEAPREAAPASGSAKPGTASEPRAAREELPERHQSSRAKRFEERASLELEREEAEEGLGLAAWVRGPGRAQSGGFKDLLTGRRREPREVHAVPTSREGKLERAFELFNASEHRRTIAGIGRSLGEPWVNAAPVGDEPAAREVGIVVAWELSWYRFRVDLDDADQAVLLLDRGDEIDDLEESLRDWNAATDGEGRLVLAAPEFVSA